MNENMQIKKALMVEILLHDIWRNEFLKNIL